MLQPFGTRLYSVSNACNGNFLTKLVEYMPHDLMSCQTLLNMQHLCVVDTTYFDNINYVLYNVIIQHSTYFLFQCDV